MTNPEALHKVWGYAKEHPEQCSDGYDKKAFMHVAFWFEKAAIAALPSDTQGRGDGG